jgi:hypothetical protein
MPGCPAFRHFKNFMVQKRIIPARPDMAGAGVSLYVYDVEKSKLNFEMKN